MKHILFVFAAVPALITATVTLFFPNQPGIIFTTAIASSLFYVAMFWWFSREELRLENARAMLQKMLESNREDGGALADFFAQKPNPTKNSVRQLLRDVYQRLVERRMQIDMNVCNLSKALSTLIRNSDQGAGIPTLEGPKTNDGRTLQAAFGLLGHKLKRYYNKQNIYGTILRDLPVATVMLNQQGQLLFANPAAERLFGSMFRSLQRVKFPELLAECAPEPENDDPCRQEIVAPKDVLKRIRGSSPHEFHVLVKSKNSDKIRVAIQSFGKTKKIVVLRDARFSFDEEQRARRIHRREAVVGFVHRFSKQISEIVNRFEEEMEAERTSLNDNSKATVRTLQLHLEMLDWLSQGERTDLSSEITSEIPIHEVVTEITESLKPIVERAEKRLQVSGTNFELAATRGTLKAAISGVVLHAIRDAQSPIINLAFSELVTSKSHKIHFTLEYDGKCNPAIMRALSDPYLSLIPNFFAEEEHGSLAGLYIARLFCRQNGGELLVEQPSPEKCRITFTIPESINSGNTARIPKLSTPEDATADQENGIFCPLPSSTD